MEASKIIEERITFVSSDLLLAGVLAYPESAEPSRSVLICSPHPHFAGNMDNNVVQAVARSMAADSLTLRFDYRGVGESTINLPPEVSVFDYWSEVEDTKDYSGALTDVGAAALEINRVAQDLPMAIVGYSFGAAVGLEYGCKTPAVDVMVGISPPLIRVGFEFLADSQKPTLLLSAKDDFVYSADAMANLQAISGCQLKSELVESGDHFFRGEEEGLCIRVGAFVRGALSAVEGENY